MSTPEQRQQQISVIQNRSQEILNLDIENDLVKREMLGAELTFESIRDSFIHILDIIKKVSECSLSQVPFSNLSSYSGTINRIKETLLKIKQFSAANPDPVNQKNSLITSVNNNVEQLLEHATPILLINLLHGNDLSLERAKLSSLIEEFDKARNSSLDYILSVKEKMESTLESVQRAAAKVGVTQHAFVFKEESEIHFREAKKWLIGTICVLITTAAAGIGFMFWTPLTSDRTTHVVQFTITKVVVLAVLFYTLSICIKNYRAHKHNAILNKHRQNALQTFETFVKASTDEQTKNAVLLQTTQSIFSNQQTGYSSGENDGDVPSKVIEIIKSTGPKTQG